MNTRAYVLSDSNPFYFSTGTDAAEKSTKNEKKQSMPFAGIGGAHEYLDMIWPMGLVREVKNGLNEALREKVHGGMYGMSRVRGKIR